MTGVEQSVGVGDPLERERLLHVDAELAPVDEGGEPAQGDGVDGVLESLAAAATG